MTITTVCVKRDPLALSQPGPSSLYQMQQPRLKYQTSYRALFALLWTFLCPRITDVTHDTGEILAYTRTCNEMNVIPHI